MALLARREHSEHELGRKLQQKGFAAQEVDAVLADLKARNLLSDERFTEALINSRRERGFGPLRVRQDLQAKGVAQDLIDRWVDADDPSWLETLRRVWRKKFAGQPPSAYKEWARQARYLQTRGFSAEQIRKVIDITDST